MIVKIFRIFIFISLIFFTFSYISFPLKIYNNTNIEKIFSSPNEIEEDYFFILLYKVMEIGEPRQKIIFFISPNEYNFYMILNNENEIKEDSYYYDIKKSNSSNIYFGENEVGSIANTFFIKEKLYFNNEDIINNKKEEIGIKDIDFVLFSKRPKVYKELNLSSNINSYMVFGLRLCESIDRIEYALNLIRQLKIHNITDNYKWFINYNINKNEIKTNFNFDNNIQMIIGADPHIVYPNNYDENNLRLVNAKSNKGYIFWGLKFDKIYTYQNDGMNFELNNDININTTNIEDFLTGEIKHDLFFLYSPKEYFEFINKNFFNKLIFEKACFINGEKYKVIFCKNNPENKKYIKNNFKTIYFKHHEYNYIFELGYEDLFLEYNNIILFLVIYRKNYNNWGLGIPFLRKYLLTYDYDFKVIGFYNDKNKNIIKVKINKFFFFKAIIIILLLLICGIFGFFLSKKIFGLNRRKRINEMEDDNYRYQEKDKYEINKKIDDSKNESLIGLEMAKFI